MVREMHGLAELEVDQPAVVAPGRIHVACSSCICQGGVLLVNVYLEAGVGTNQDNREAFLDLDRCLKQHRKPCIVGWGFNMTEDVLQQSGLLRLFDAEVVRPVVAACAASGKIIELGF